MSHVVGTFTINDVATVLALAPRQQPWKYEAPCRAAIRQHLCLAGWRWWAADRKAFVLVARARIQLGVRQPAGFDSDYDLSSWIDSVDCVVCDHRFVPRREGHCFCSEACQRRHAYLETRPAELRRCEKCRDWLSEPRPNQRYCSAKCRKAAQQARVWERHKLDQITHCQQCGTAMPPTVRADALFCSPACLRADEFAKRRARRHAAREAADREAPRQCAHCAAPLPIGAYAQKVYCDARCAHAAAYQRSKLNGNGHANGNGSAAGDRPDAAGGAPGAPPDQPGAHAGPPGAARTDAARAGARG